MKAFSTRFLCWSENLTEAVHPSKINFPLLELLSLSLINNQEGFAYSSLPRVSGVVFCSLNITKDCIL